MDIFGNEVIFLATVVIDLLAVLWATKLGKNWLVSLIIANIVLVQLTAVKNVEAWGLIFNASAAFYAGIFIATDILTEHWGKKEGYASVWKAFFVVLFLVVLGNLVRFFVPVDVNAATQAFDVLFDSALRITAASMIAYLIAQNLDVWLYHYISEKTSHKYLWLRNNGSTLISQFVDSVVFFTIAFAGVVSNLWALILVGYLFKAFIALVDTPFMYLSYRMLGKQLPNN